MPQDWKDYFNDPALRAWIAAALANNRDLRVAALRIEEARALYGVQRADRLPSVDGTAGYSRKPRVRPRPVARCDQPAVPRWRRHHRLRAGLLRPGQEPHRRGAGTLSGQRRGAPRGRAVAGGRDRHRLFQRAFAGRAAAADSRHAGTARDHAGPDPAPLRRRSGNRHGPAHRADAGGIVARHAGRTQPRTQPGRACAGPAGGRFLAAARRRPDAAGKPEPYPAGGRPAVGAADAASGPAPGGEHAQGGQRRYRRGARGLSRRCS